MGMLRGRKLLFGCITVALGVLLLEGAARLVELWRPSRAVDIGAGFAPESRVFEPMADAPGRYVTAATKRFYFRTQVIEVPKPADVVRVAVVGGSSVNKLEEEYRAMESDLARALPALEGRRIEIVNAGGLSYGSGRMVGVVSELLTYGIDVLVVYEANNELEEEHQFRHASLKTLEFQRALSSSALVRVVRDALIAARLEQVRREAEEDALRGGAVPGDADALRAWQYRFTPEEVDRRVAAFRENYALILRLAAAKGVTVILGTVPSNLIEPELIPEERRAYAEVTRLTGESKWAEAKTLASQILCRAVGRHQSSDRENGIIRELAASSGVVLVDVERAVVAAEPHGFPGETLFEDHCHLNAAGRAIWRAAMLPELVRTLALL